MYTHNFSIRHQLEHPSFRRYWEDSLSDKIIPKVDEELENSPGPGRFERLTNDGFKYTNLVVSESNKYAPTTHESQRLNVLLQVFGICFQ